MAAKLYAVLIADVVASTSQRGFRKRLGATLAIASKRHLRRKLIRLPYSVTAGDEFQTVCADLRALPQLILTCAFSCNRFPCASASALDASRIASLHPSTVSAAKPFQLARKAIDAAKSGGAFKFGGLTVFFSRTLPSTKP